MKKISFFIGLAFAMPVVCRALPPEQEKALRSVIKAEADELVGRLTNKILEVVKTQGPDISDEGDTASRKSTAHSSQDSEASDFEDFLGNLPNKSLLLNNMDDSLSDIVFDERGEEPLNQTEERAPQNDAFNLSFGRPEIEDLNFSFEPR